MPLAGRLIPDVNISSAEIQRLQASYFNLFQASIKKDYKIWLCWFTVVLQKANLKEINMRNQVRSARREPLYAACPVNLPLFNWCSLLQHDAWITI
jgi:hypothetical protein